MLIIFLSTYRYVKIHHIWIQQKKMYAPYQQVYQPYLYTSGVPYYHIIIQITHT